VAAALARAIAMPIEERIERHGRLFDALKRNDVATWGDRFLATLTESPDVSRHRAPANAMDSPSWGRNPGLVPPSIPGAISSPQPSAAFADLSSRR